MNDVRAIQTATTQYASRPTVASGNSANAPSDKFQTGEAPDAGLIPKGSPSQGKAALTVSLNLPATLVAGLPGMALALVPEHEVADGRWNPAPGSQAIPTQVLHAVVSDPPAEGQSVRMFSVPFEQESVDSLGPSATGGYYLTGPASGAAGQDLAQAAQGRTGPGVLTASLAIPGDLSLEELAGKTLALIPRDGGAAAAPAVESCVHHPPTPEGQQLVQVTLTGPTQYLEAHPTEAVDNFLNPPAPYQATPEVPQWALSELEAHKVPTGDAVMRLAGLMNGQSASAEELSDPHQRKILAGANMLLAGLHYAEDVKKYGHDALEHLKVAVAHGLTPELPPGCTPEESARLLGVAAYRSGKADSFKLFGDARARGERTRADSLRFVGQQLGGTPTREAQLLDQAVARQAALCESLGRPLETTLGALKESSDLMLKSTALKLGLDGTMVAGSVALFGTLGIVTGQPWLAGGALLSLNRLDSIRETRGLRATEKEINQLLTDAIAASGTDSTMVEFVQRRLQGGQS